MTFRVLPLAAGSSVRKIVRDEHLGGIFRPPYLSDLYDVNVTVDQYLAITLTQEGKELSCGYWLGSGVNCDDISPSAPDPNSLTCPFRPFQGPREPDPGSYLADSLLVTFEQAVIELKIFGIGSPYLPLFVQNHVSGVILSPLPPSPLALSCVALPDYDAE